MKNRIYIFIVLLSVLITACVDDFQDANPPRLLDAPAVVTVSSSETILFGGESTVITISVSDAPAGIDSVAIEDTDDLGIAVGGTYVFVSGQGITQGEVVAEYTAPMGFSGSVELAVSVVDAQLDDKGKKASKSSVPRTVLLQVFCAQPDAGDYRVVMHDSFDDGWQTNDANGGDGLQVTLFDGTVLEVGMCNPYVASAFDCAPGDFSDAEDVITIPVGTLSAEWYFPGDRYGEISFEIYSPTDELLFASGAPGETGEGSVQVIDCDM